MVWGVLRGSCVFSKILPNDLFWVLTGVAASAGIGNTVASVFRVPYEVVKQRLQAGVYDTTYEVRILPQVLRTTHTSCGDWDILILIPVICSMPPGSDKDVCTKGYMGFLW